MAHRPYVSSLHVAEESLRTGAVVIESLRNLTKRVRLVRDEASRKSAEASRSGNFLATIGDIPSFMFTYGARGVEFTVVVYERKRWFTDGDVDGITVMSRGADGTDETAHFTTRLADLPAPVRRVALDVRAVLNYDKTSADKARDRRYETRRRDHEESILTRHPEWRGDDGHLDRAKMDRDVDRILAHEEQKWQ